ncbi:MAG: hypothetical protein IT555_04235 [Acetobacteraceae bacterium]|nr:hypothetical protein [Acetobacteraceae bacterium]
MISNLSLSAFSAADLRPAGPRPPAARPPSDRPPVEASPQVDRVRAQSETRPAQGGLSLGSTPPAAPPGRPPPRGSLLDLSV